ncbi:MAG TPA: DUF1992 domain-containing protein [Pyrinomonadaceae bacterium]|nr:DUF1992 domain-containing protein [Pyrinomonadaceae bacterium]
MFDKLVEQKIREAQRAGEFDRLEGAGRPVNLDAYFSAPEELHAGFAVLKNAGVLPEEAQLRAEINALRERLDACVDPRERTTLTRSLGELTLKYSLMVERYRNATRRTE